MKKAKLERIGGYHAYATIWCAKFRYCSPCVGFNYSRLEVITKKIIGPSLAAAGYSSKMPRAVVFGPQRYGGMQWETPLSILLTAQITILIGSLRLNDIIGKLVRIQLEWIQLHAGLGTPLLETGKVLDYIPAGWIANLHRLLVYADLTVKIDNVWCVKPRRTNDRIIMEYVQDHLPEWTWGSINKCRIYLQAVVISDLVDIPGKTISPGVYQVAGRFRHSRLAFPSQATPTDKDIDSWQYFIQHITEEGKTLNTPLGGWIKNPYQKYLYVMDLKTKLVYKQSGETNWELFHHTRRTRNRYEPSGLQQGRLPQHWIPVRVIEHSCRQLGVIDCASVDTRTIEQPPILGVFVSKEYRKVVGQFEIDKQEVQNLRNKWGSERVTLLCGTDGGLKDEIGTTGYIIIDPNGSTPVVMGYAAEKQPREDASSTRQELLAQLAVMYRIDHFIKNFGESGWEVHIHLVMDSQASIDILEHSTEAIGIKDVMRAEMDVADAVWYRRDNLPRTRYTVSKVKSHINKEEAEDESHWEINNMADRLATDARGKVLSVRLTEPMLFEGVKAGCMRRGRLITGTLKTEIQQVLYEDKIKQYLGLKYGWNESIFNKIDWEGQHAVIGTIPITKKVTLMKYIH